MSTSPDIEEFTEQATHIAWYTLRILSINEDKVVTAILEKIKYYKLEEKVLDIQIIKEYMIEESKDFLPNSPDLPARVVKNSETSIWVKTPYGTFKKIKLIEKRPFKGLAFVKLLFEKELIRIIKSWDRTVYFLGDPTPHAMTESSFLKMKGTVSDEVPCLHEYMQKHNYSVVNGSLRNMEVTPAQEKEREEILRKIEAKKAKEEQEASVTKEQKSEKGVVSEKSTVSTSVIGKPISDIKKLKVNDYVFVIDFGAQGQIKNINLDTKEIVVSIQAFGRSQPITCDLSKLREI